MKLLITGYKGFIGKNAVEYFGKKHDLVLYEWGDKFPELDGIDRVLHFGAISSTTETNVERIMAQNYDFTIGLFAKCQAKGIPVQFSSSASVYGQGTEFKETSKVDPKTPYAWSKYMVEKYVTKNKLNVQCFRYFNVYGPHEEHKGSQASPYCQFKKQAEQNGYINVFKGSEKYKRDFVPVQTVLEIQEKFMTIPEAGIWNIGTGEVKSFMEIAESFNVPINQVPMPNQLSVSYQTYTRADLTKLQQTLQLYK